MKGPDSIDAKNLRELEREVERLHEVEHKFNTLINESAHGYAEFDTTGKIYFANRRAEEMVGRKVEEGVSISDLLHPDDLERALRDLALVYERPNIGPKEYRYRATGGKERRAEVNTLALRRDGAVIGFQTTILDIEDRKRGEEERKQLEERLYQSQKMEAIGLLAGGVAHDFNNLLTAVLGHAVLIKMRAEPDSRVWRSADSIEKAAQRAGELTTQLLGFARKGKHQIHPVDLHALIEESVALLGRTIGKDIIIRAALAADPRVVMGDPSQLQQVLMNLAVNARDAMAQGGTITFSTKIVRGADPIKKRIGLGPGPYIQLTITDTGTGIPRENLRRIFEPFFTTKEKGKGTGMGLAMVYGIVMNHGGVVQVESAPGLGASFIIYLPADESAEIPSRAPGPVDIITGAGTIMVIDDEDVVLEVAREMLEELGYRVVTFAAGAEAVDYFRRNYVCVSLVLIDMVMPGMDGRECFLALREIDPRIRAVLSTGYGIDGKAQSILDLGMGGFVQKPYRLDELAGAVKNALAPKPAKGE